MTYRPESEVSKNPPDMRGEAGASPAGSTTCRGAREAKVAGPLTPRSKGHARSNRALGARFLPRVAT